VEIPHLTSLTTNLAGQQSYHYAKKAPDKSIFISTNRFSPIASATADEPTYLTVTKELNNVNKTSIPPPIFIQDQINYNNFCIKIIELTDANDFDSKSSTKGRKLQTYSPESYKIVIKYLKKQCLI